MIETSQFNWALLHRGLMTLLDEEIMNPIVEVSHSTFVSLSQLTCVSEMRLFLSIFFIPNSFFPQTLIL